MESNHFRHIQSFYSNMTGRIAGAENISCIAGDAAEVIEDLERRLEKQKLFIDVIPSKYMRYKDFINWCDERDAAKNWEKGTQAACVEIIVLVNRVPFWNREREWRKYLKDAFL